MKSIPLTQRTLVGGICLVVGFMALVLGLGTLSWDGRAPGVTASDPRVASELETMEAQVARLDQQLEDLLQREEELRLVADLPPAPVEVHSAGVGGPGLAAYGSDAGVRELTGRLTSVSTSLDVLLKRSELMASGMEDVKVSIASKNAKLEATPSIWPTSGFLSSTYSMHRRHPIFHDIRPHYGIDISARRGSPIVATAAGKVVKAGWLNGHGNHVEIDHGHGLTTTYSHASRVLVKRGQRVRRGNTVALVGSTGFSVAPHVHYEVHEKGRPIDPLRYIFPNAIAD